LLEKEVRVGDLSLTTVWGDDGTHYSYVEGRSKDQREGLTGKKNLCNVLGTKTCATNWSDKQTYSNVLVSFSVTRAELTGEL
jgi:hypothetical protein